MTITRINPQARWSDVTVFNNTVYFVEVADNPEDEVEGQFRQILQQAEIRLASVGSSKESLLQVTIYFTDRKNLAIINRLWEAWLPAGSAPVRAAVKAEMVDPCYLIELSFIAGIVS